jgi:hypothetical protein
VAVGPPATIPSYCHHGGPSIGRGPAHISQFRRYFEDRDRAVTLAVTSSHDRNLDVTSKTVTGATSRQVASGSSRGRNVISEPIRELQLSYGPHRGYYTRCILTHSRWVREGGEVLEAWRAALSAPRTHHYCLLIVHVTIVCSSYTSLLSPHRTRHYCLLLVHVTIVCSSYTSLLPAPRTGLFSLLLSACLCRVRKRPFSRLYPCLLRSRITSRMLLCSSLLTLVLHSRIMI